MNAYVVIKESHTLKHCVRNRIENYGNEIFFFILLTLLLLLSQQNEAVLPVVVNAMKNVTIFFYTMMQIYLYKSIGHFLRY